ncbi:MAG: phosphoheptose isomerase [Robiginitomaculum sp.]|nr:MAG: phosphoheptose isomerase [Robiginitomaculum sp.]
MSKKKHLSDLYPFLHGKQQDGETMQKALLTSVRQKAADHVNVFEKYFEKNQEDIVSAAKIIAETYRQNGRLFTMGNGGSSCDAAHVAVEFLHPVTTGRPALTAINLTTDVAMMTAVSNDIGYEHVYARQIIAQGRKGDCLIGISTSGNSANLIKAFQKASDMGLSTIGLSGMSGGEMAKAGLDACLTVETDSIHRVQECHVATYHILWDIVHTLLADDRGGLNNTGDKS